MSSVHEKIQKLIDDHFAGRIRLDGEREMRAHLPGCEPCRDYYDRQVLLAEVDPRVAGAQERLALGLGLSERKTLRLFPAVPALAAVAMAAVALVALWPLLESGEPEFRPRGEGPPTVPAMLLVYQVPAGEKPRLATDTIGANDELAFAYENRDGKQHLLVFGVDDRQRIYWYHPAWTDAATNPQAVAIAAGPERRELPEAVAHRLEGRSLQLYGIFTDQPLGVQDVERMFRARERATDPLPIRDAIQQSLMFRISR